MVIATGGGNPVVGVWCRGGEDCDRYHGLYTGVDLRAAASNAASKATTHSGVVVGVLNNSVLFACIVNILSTLY
jgi:hypothetical protein